MVEIDGVANADSLGGGIYDFVATVVMEGQANAEYVLCAEVSGIAWSGLFMDGDFASDGNEQCGVVVDGTVVLFPR